ncbi:MAG: hypothetical protein E3J35_02770 [Methanomassiliicoccales archaeon]|nr:MAG: hypothetical protein E3J35_02770 [Methanomassiliicoccales archaeon]
MRRSAFLKLCITIFCLFTGLVQLNITDVQGTNVSGDIESDTTWTLQNSPYIVVGNVRVESGVTLTIEPGVQVRFDGYYGISVYGVLRAMGNEDNRINITSNSESPAPEDWRNIRILSGGLIEMSFADISYGHYVAQILNSGRGIITHNNIFRNTYTVNIRSNSVVSNNHFSYNEYGIYSTGTNNTINDNEFFLQSMDGVRLDISSDNTVVGNSIFSAHMWGISLRKSFNNTIANNFVFSTMREGIRLTGSSYNTITNNTVSKCGDGISLHSSNDTVIFSNLLSNNGHGIALESSSNVTIANNTVFSNRFRGISLTSQAPSTETIVYHNNIIDNDYQGYNFGASNFWNDSYPSGGNYWSDYSGVDLNGTPSQDVPPPDGLGDTPYEFSLNSKDIYPLMEPWPFAPQLDDTKPSPPENLIATIDVERSQITLRWEKNDELDVELYSIYRGESEEGRFLDLWWSSRQECSDTHCSYVDTWVEEGETYWYYVVAVNLLGNDSPGSNKVNVTMPEHEPDTDSSTGPWFVISLVVVAVTIAVIVSVAILVRKKKRSL